MRGPFWSTVAATYLDRDAVIRTARRVVSEAMAKDPDIERVILFGSLAWGTAGPRSDADILIVLKSSRHVRRMDRIPDLSRVLSGIPISMDIIAVTREELEREIAMGNRFFAKVLAEGVDLSTQGEA